MSALIYALFEVVRTLAEAGDEVRGVALGALRAAEEAYMEEVGRDGAIDRSFRILEDAFIRDLPSSAEEALVSYAVGELAAMEEDLGVDRDRVAEALVSALPEDGGLRDLVLFFARVGSEFRSNF